MEDLNDLYYFAQVVDHGGFAPAGRALDMPKSKLSRRIAGLEERLGVRLIQRSTRHFSVTEIGQAYYRHCVAMLVEAEGAAELIERNRAEPQGIVRLSCPTALLNFWVGEMLARFMVQCPLVQLHIESTNRQVDLIQEGIDIALRVRFPPLESSDLVMKTLAHSTNVLWPHRRCSSNCLPGRCPQTSAPCQACTGAGRNGIITGNWWALTRYTPACAISHGWSLTICWYYVRPQWPVWVWCMCRW